MVAHVYLLCKDNYDKTPFAAFLTREEAVEAASSMLRGYDNKQPEDFVLALPLFCSHGSGLDERLILLEHDVLIDMICETLDAMDAAEEARE